MPDLKEGIIGDLVLPSDAVLDPKARKLFSEERKIPLFKKKTPLYVQLRPATAEDTKLSKSIFSGRSQRAAGSMFNSNSRVVNPSTLNSTIIHPI
jgi:hypothetical protein